MASMQNYLKNALNNHLLRTTPYTRPDNTYLCLFTTKPDKNGANGTEVTGDPYARVECGPLDANWDVPDSTGKVVSLVEFQFERPTEAWGTIVAWGLADAATGGNFLVVEDVTTPLEVTATSLAPVFPVGLLTFTWT